MRRNGVLCPVGLFGSETYRCRPRELRCLPGGAVPVTGERTFLDVAETLLRDHGPATADDIVRRATERGELNESRGRTPAATLRAALSRDILALGSESRFQRVEPNKFALRSPTLTEYRAKRFTRVLPKESVTCIPQEAIDRASRFFGLRRSAEKYLRAVLRDARLEFLPRTEAENRDNFKQIIAYVILRDEDGRVLTYRRGRLSSAELLKGALCVGFGGHVTSNDTMSLFGQKDAGVSLAAAREIAEELRGTEFPTDLELLGVINDDSSPLGLRHLGVVLEGGLPPGFTTKGPNRERAVTQLEFLTEAELWESFHELEFWSQLVCREFFSQPEPFDPVVITPASRPVQRAPIFIVGEIGSGKTEVSEFLQQRYQLPVVSTRECVAELIHSEDFKTGDRHDFQRKALELVSRPEGVRRLASSIEIRARALSIVDRPVLVDGIRNIGTLELLQDAFPTSLLLYVETPRDTAYRLYRQRAKGRSVDIREFREARHHAVESEVSLFKYRAEAYIFNGGTLQQLRAKVAAWFEGK